MSEQIEERLAHLERLADELNEVVVAQGAEVGLLKARLRMLMEREASREVQNTGGVILGDERPPHY